MGPINKRPLGRAGPPCATLDTSKTPLCVLLQGGKGHRTCMVVSIDIIFMHCCCSAFTNRELRGASLLTAVSLTFVRIKTGTDMSVPICGIPEGVE